MNREEGAVERDNVTKENVSLGMNSTRIKYKNGFEFFLCFFGRKSSYPQGKNEKAYIGVWVLSQMMFCYKECGYEMNSDVCGGQV